MGYLSGGLIIHVQNDKKITDDLIELPALVRNITPSCAKQLELTFLWRQMSQIGTKSILRFRGLGALADLVCYTCYTAVFSVLTQRSSPQSEVRCVTTLKTTL